MTGWGGGYVTDIAYMTSYHRQQSPALLALSCLLNGVACDLPAADDAVEYLELGCGHGYGALVLAASNPRWRITGIDFNPAHIASARRFAAEAGLGNAVFHEADLATLAEAPLLAAIPEADFISVHGVWSWVAPPVRAGILRLLRARVRAGGVVHVSYNAQPGWQRATGMQRLLHEAGLRLGHRSDRQAQAGLRVVQALREAGAKQLGDDGFIAAMIEKMQLLPVEYLAHEYMNAAWSPCFHADVARDFAEARLDWVGSASLLENFPTLVLTEAQRAVADRFEEPVMRELVKDLCLDRLLRQDVFVRGARRLDETARAAALEAVPLALATPAADFVYAADMPVGRAALKQEAYAPLVAALAAGPQRLGTLLAAPSAAALSGQPVEVVGMLVGTEQATVALRPEAPPDPGAARFNRVAAGRFVALEALGRPVAAASVRLGAGLVLSALELFVLDRLAEGGPADPAGWARALAAGRLDDAETARLQATIDHLLDGRAELWRAAGLHRDPAPSQ